MTGDDLPGRGAASRAESAGYQRRLRYRGDVGCYLWSQCESPGHPGPAARSWRLEGDSGAELATRRPERPVPLAVPSMPLRHGLRRAPGLRAAVAASESRRHCGFYSQGYHRCLPREHPATRWPWPGPGMRADARLGGSPRVRQPQIAGCQCWPPVARPPRFTHIPTLRSRCTP